MCCWLLVVGRVSCVVCRVSCVVCRVASRRVWAVTPRTKREFERQDNDDDDEDEEEEADEIPVWGEGRRA